MIVGKTNSNSDASNSIANGNNHGNSSSSASLWSAIVLNLDAAASSRLHKPRAPPAQLEQDMLGIALWLAGLS